MSKEPNDSIRDLSSERTLSAKEYAAIHLKVPMSGTLWLDNMIDQSRKDDFVKAALIGYTADIERTNNLLQVALQKYSDPEEIVGYIHKSFAASSLDLAEKVIKKSDE